MPKEKSIFKLDALFPFQIDHFLPDVVHTICLKFVMKNDCGKQKDKIIMIRNATIGNACETTKQCDQHLFQVKFEVLIYNRIMRHLPLSVNEPVLFQSKSLWILIHNMNIRLFYG